MGGSGMHQCMHMRAGVSGAKAFLLLVCRSFNRYEEVKALRLSCVQIFQR